jgi:hypothetical protein
MKTPPDVVEDRPPWLSEAMIRIRKMPRDMPARRGVEGHAVALLRSIEADSIPCPAVCVTDRGSIRLHFTNSHRTLIVFVTGVNTYSVVQVDRDRRLPRVDVYADRVQTLRKFVVWLFPGSNQGTVQMVAGWRDLGNG